MFLCQPGSKDGQVIRRGSFQPSRPTASPTDPTTEVLPPVACTRQTSLELPFTPLRSDPEPEKSATLPRPSTLADPDRVFENVIRQTDRGLAGMNNFI